MVENMKNVFVMMFVLMAFSSCRDYKIESEKEIKDLLFHQSQDWNRGDIDAYMSYYWNSDSLRFASGNRVTYGWKQTLENYKKAYPNKEIMGELIFSNIEVDLFNKNDALAFGRWHLQREKDEPQGLFTLKLKRIQNKWKIVSDHTSAAN
jgi:ketosteroid isomerase-like protein